MTIRSRIGYVRLVKKIIGGFWKSCKVKKRFSKEVEKCISKYIYLNGYQSQMNGSRSAILCMYLLLIYKKTGLKGILPQCYIKITKFCFKQNDFFLFLFLFWKSAFGLVWLLKISDYFFYRTYIFYMTSNGHLSILSKKYIFGLRC